MNTSALNSCKKVVLLIRNNIYLSTYWYNRYVLNPYCMPETGIQTVCVCMHAHFITFNSGAQDKTHREIKQTVEDMIK
jgi:hypothetical protein